MELAGRGGWETLHDLKTNSETNSIPVIIVSPGDERKMGVALGAAECLVKPLSKESLLCAVNKAIGSKGTLQVLIVDDDPETRQLIADTLLTDGHAALTARNASEALRMLTGTQIDAVVLDLLLPGGRSGFDGSRIFARSRS